MSVSRKARLTAKSEDEPILVRLDELIRERFNDNLASFCRQADVLYSTVINWFRRGSPPEPLKLEAIARRVGVSPSWLLAGEGPVDLPPEPLTRPEMRLVEAKGKWFRGLALRIEAYFPIPLVAGSVAAGSPTTVSENDVDDWIPAIYHKDWCPHPDQTVCVRVKGDSMAPTIPDGGLVAIDLVQRDPARLVRRVVALRRDGGVTVKRLVRLGDGRYVARPDNPDSAELYVYGADEIADAVVGKVVWWWGKQ
jgi:SOS-response transcriptional repressor LexA